MPDPLADGHVARRHHERGGVSSDASRARHCRIIATKTVGVGEVRILLAWERGRWSEGMIAREGYASAFTIQSVTAAREVIADPGAGFVLTAGSSLLPGFNIAG